MGHQSDITHIAQLPQLPPEGLHTLRLKAQPVHATVHFQVNIQRRMKPGILQGFNLPVAVHAGGQAIFIKQRQLVGVEKAFQHQNRPFPAALAQEDRLLQIKQRETVGAFQRTPDTIDSMTVGVSLHH